MADAGLFIGWGEVVRGRETEALEISHVPDLRRVYGLVERLCA